MEPLKISSIPAFKRLIYNRATITRFIWFIFLLPGLIWYSGDKLNTFIQDKETQRTNEVNEKLPAFLKTWEYTNQQSNGLVRWNGADATLIFVRHKDATYFNPESWKLWCQYENGTIFSLVVFLSDPGSLKFSADLKSSSPGVETRDSLLRVLIEDNQTELIKKLDFKTIEKSK